MFHYGYVTHRAIYLRRITARPSLTLRRQHRLGRFTQNTLQGGQEDHAIEVLRDGVDTVATEALDFKDILNPIMIGLMLPAPAVHGLELSRGIGLGIE